MLGNSDHGSLLFLICLGDSSLAKISRAFYLSREFNEVNQVLNVPDLLVQGSEYMNDPDSAQKFFNRMEKAHPQDECRLKKENELR